MQRGNVVRAARWKVREATLTDARASKVKPIVCPEVAFESLRERASE